MAKDITAMRGDQQRTTANSYLGHRVTVDAGNGQTAIGDVSAVDNSGTEPMLVVNGGTYSLSAVLRVEPGAITSSNQQPASSGTN
jgi:hypothetical protein